MSRSKGSKKKTGTKKDSNKQKKAKINVTYIFHLWLDNLRKVTEIIPTSHYKKPIIDTNWIDLEPIFEDLPLSKYYISLNHIGSVDIYCEHPDVEDYVEIASYNNRRKQISWKPAIVTFQPSKKSKSKQNESLLYQIVYDQNKMVVQIINVMLNYVYYH